jgi:hypothetical protein
MALNQWVPGSSPGGARKIQLLLTRAGFSSLVPTIGQLVTLEEKTQQLDLEKSVNLFVG